MRGNNTPSTNAATAGGGASDSSRSSSTGPRPYPRVITKEAKTRVGMFKTHIVGDKLYFEIPTKEMNREMLMVGRFERSAVSAGDFDGYGGDQFTERTLRWERSGNRVILRSPSFAFTADSTLPVYQAVTESSNPAIVAIFPVEAYGPDSAAVVDVNSLRRAARLTRKDRSSRERLHSLRTLKSRRRKLRRLLRRQVQLPEVLEAVVSRDRGSHRAW